MVQNYSSPTAAEFIRAWKRAGARMQELRDRGIREADTVVAMQQLSGAFNQAIAQLPLRDTSGLVEQQAWFSKLRAREGVHAQACGYKLYIDSRHEDFQSGHSLCPWTSIPLR